MPWEPPPNCAPSATTPATGWPPGRRTSWSAGKETARPLLTSGEVMQLPSTDELVLVSGLAPIRANKLRCFEDENFSDRVLAPPTLPTDGYPDKPPQRPDDWSGHVRGVDPRLVGDEDGAGFEGGEEGGVQHQRHPGLPEEAVVRPVDPSEEDLFGLGEDDGDVAADKRVMDLLLISSFVLRGIRRLVL